MAKSEGDAKQAAADSFSAGATKLRETAKWLITAFGGLGAALVTSLSLSSLGDIEGSQLRWALVGFGLGIVGTGAGIFAIARVLIVTATSFRDISGPESDKNLARAVTHQTALLAGFPSIDELVRVHLTAQKDRVDAFEFLAHPPDGANNQIASKQQQFERAERELKLTSPIVNQVLGYAGFLRVRRRFVQSLIALSVALSVAGTGIGMFAYYGTTTASPQASTTLPGRPVAAILDLNPAGSEMLRDLLGAKCKLDDVLVLALDAQAETVNVATVPSSSCEIARFTVTPEIGTVCPVDPALRPPPPSPGSVDQPGVVVC